MSKSTLSTTLKALFVSANKGNSSFDNEIELWANLYHTVRLQQQFAEAMLPILEQLQSPLLEEAKAITALNSLINRNQGILLMKVDHIKDPALRQNILSLIHS